MTHPLRVGLIGTGLMGHTHARAWRQRPGVLTSVLASNPQARGFAQTFNLTPHESIEHLLDGVDLVDICTPTPAHAVYAVQAAQAGRHVICEKPIALTLADADAMISACETAGVRLFIAHVLRFFPQYTAAHAQVQAGAIGKPRVLRLSRVSSPPTAGSWLLDESQSGGVPLDLMIHDLDYARWIAGDVQSVYAAESRAQGKVAVQATLSHQSGAISLIEGGWAAPEGVFRTSIDIAGTSGVIEWSSDAPAPLRQHGAPLPAQKQEGAALPALEGDPYAVQLWHAYDAMQHGTPFLVTAQDARAALALALAVGQSIQTGQAVNP